jgi:endonuclease YncB( thermonuclease family)
VSKHWQPSGKIVQLRPARGSRWTRTGAYVAPGDGVGAGAVVAILLCAILLGLAVGIYWPSEQPTVAQDQPVTIDLQTADVVDDADLEWERRALQDPGDSAPGAGQAAGQRASFGFCHTGGGSNCVVDGDTFYLGGEKVRIAGIDAPETHPPRCAEEARLGEAATQQLQALLNSGAVTMTSIDRDRDSYGRRLRNVAVDGADVGEAMIGAGVAREYGSGRRGWCG